MISTLALPITSAVSCDWWLAITTLSLYTVQLPNVSAHVLSTDSGQTTSDSSSARLGRNMRTPAIMRMAVIVLPACRARRDLSRTTACEVPNQCRRAKPHVVQARQRRLAALHDRLARLLRPQLLGGDDLVVVERADPAEAVLHLNDPPPAALVDVLAADRGGDVLLEAIEPGLLVVVHLGAALLLDHCRGVARLPVAALPRRTRKRGGGSSTPKFTCRGGASAHES